MAEPVKVENFEQAFAIIKKRYSDDKIKKPLKDFDKPVMITCLDTNRSFMILVNKDQGIEIKDKTTDPNAPMKIHFARENVLMQLFNKEIGAVEAYKTGAVKVIEGDIKSLLKLRKLLF